MELNYRLEAIDERTDIIYFMGDINEDSEISLANLVDQVVKDSVFNLKDVTSINSCGVRAWINFLREVEKKNLSIVFEECTPEVVSQINMIPNFKGRSRIRSVYASYVCENCDFQNLELFKEGENLPTSLEEEIAEVKCPKCQSTMEMEELEEEFFSWIENS